MTAYAVCRNDDMLGAEMPRCLVREPRMWAHSIVIALPRGQYGVPVDKILSSPWCRCLETARLMALGPVESVMVVASSERSPERLVVLKEMVAAWRGPGTLVLVTNALTVRALVGIMPEQAETVVVRPRLGDEAGMDVVGRISTLR